MLSLVYETCRGVLYAKLTILIVNQSVKAVAPMLTWLSVLAGELRRGDGPGEPAI